MKRGFSLIEVLLAFAVLTSCLTVVATAFSRHITALRFLQDSLIADPLTENALIHEALKEQVQFPDEGVSPDLKFETRLSRADLPLEDPAVQGLFFEEIIARTEWMQAAAPRSITASIGFPKKKSTEPSPS